ncbi:MAG: hypothetical protein OXC10_16895 [Rhodospirillaceae bacterium]|nr:hypothetical protein [Rhodospirillaceae bacterium]
MTLETWDEAVLRIVRAKAGPILAREIYQEMERHPLVTPHHREIWGSQPRYHHWIRSALARLKNDRKVRHVGRSLYESA